MVKIDNNNTRKIGDKLNIDYNIVPFEIFKYGLKVELEHGYKFKKSNITNDDLIMTGKIVLAHLIEYPDYYQRLKIMEEEADKYWSNKYKPNPIKKKTTFNWILIILILILIIIVVYFTKMYTFQYIESMQDLQPL